MKQNKSIWTMAEKLEEAQMIEESLMEISREEGRKEGEEKAKKELIKQMLSLKYHTDASTWVSSLSSNQLKQAPGLILACDTFDELQNQLSNS